MLEQLGARADVDRVRAIVVLETVVVAGRERALAVEYVRAAAEYVAHVVHAGRADRVDVRGRCIDDRDARAADHVGGPLRVHAEAFGRLHLRVDLGREHGHVQRTARLVERGRAHAELERRRRHLRVRARRAQQRDRGGQRGATPHAAAAQLHPQPPPRALPPPYEPSRLSSTCSSCRRAMAFASNVIAGSASNSLSCGFTVAQPEASTASKRRRRGRCA